MLINPTFLVRLSVLISKQIQLYNISVSAAHWGFVSRKFMEKTRENAFRQTPAAIVLNYGNSLWPLFYLLSCGVSLSYVSGMQCSSFSSQNQGFTSHTNTPKTSQAGTNKNKTSPTNASRCIFTKHFKNHFLQ